MCLQLLGKDLILMSITTEDFDVHAAPPRACCYTVFSTICQEILSSYESLAKIPEREYTILVYESIYMISLEVLRDINDRKHSTG